MFKSLIATIALACALVAPTTNVVYARGMTTTCEGKISWHPLRAYTAITKNYGTPEVSDECIFVTKSRVGRQILKTCPEDSMCSVEADIENASDQYEITRVISINRIGTPALDAVAAREKAAREQSRWIAIFLYSEKVKTCVANNLKGERTADSIGEVMKGVCSKESDALRAQLMKQFSYSGHYLFMNIRYELASDGYCARVVKTSDGFVALRKEPNAKSELVAAMRPDFPVHVGAQNWTKWVRVSAWITEDEPEPDHGWVYAKYLMKVPCSSSKDFRWWNDDEAEKPELKQDIPPDRESNRESHGAKPLGLASRRHCRRPRR